MASADVATAKASATLINNLIIVSSSCHFGETVAAEAVAARLRRLSGSTRSFAWFAYGYAIAATLLAGTVLLTRVI